MQGNEMLEDFEGSKPSWYRVVASYIRGFHPGREPTDRYEKAVQKTWLQADARSKAVFGKAKESTLTGRERARVFTKTVYLVMRTMFFNYFVEPDPQQEAYHEKEETHNN